MSITRMMTLFVSRRERPAHIPSDTPTNVAPTTGTNVRVNLCGAGTAPACPTTASGTITGDQGVIAGGISFDSLYSAMKTSSGTSGAYVNIHTAQNPGGEIRGQVLPAN